MAFVYCFWGLETYVNWVFLRISSHCAKLIWIRIFCIVHSIIPSFGNNDDIVKNFNSFNQSFSFSSTMTCLKFFRNESHLHIPMRSYLTEIYTRKKKSNLHLAKMYVLSLRQKQSFLKCWLVSSNFFFQKMYTRYIFTVSHNSSNNPKPPFSCKYAVYVSLMEMFIDGDGGA